MDSRATALPAIGGGPARGGPPTEWDTGQDCPGDTSGFPAGSLTHVIREHPRLHPYCVAALSPGSTGYCHLWGERTGQPPPPPGDCAPARQGFARSRRALPVVLTPLYRRATLGVAGRLPPTRCLQFLGRARGAARRPCTQPGQPGKGTLAAHQQPSETWGGVSLRRHRRCPLKMLSGVTPSHTVGGL